MSGARRSGCGRRGFRGLERSDTFLGAPAPISILASLERKGQRREPSAADVRFVSERIGWLPFAGSSGSARVSVGTALARSIWMMVLGNKTCLVNPGLQSNLPRAHSSTRTTFVPETNTARWMSSRLSRLKRLASGHSNPSLCWMVKVGVYGSKTCSAVQGGKS